jgi:hypothetical protein
VVKFLSGVTSEMMNVNGGRPKRARQTPQKFKQMKSPAKKTKTSKFTSVKNPPVGLLLGKDVEAIRDSKKKGIKTSAATATTDETADELLVPNRKDLPGNLGNLNEKAQNVAQSSVLLPEEFPKELEGEVRRKWREMCSGQVFNGDLLERDFITYVTRNGPSTIIDIDRWVASGAGSASFLEIVKMRPGKTMFFKSKFNLAKVNSFTDVFARKRDGTSVTWAGLKNMTKGKDDVEPDVLIWEWDGRTRPILNVIEMKAGFGEAQASDSKLKEYIQLCRTKRTFEHWFDQLQEKVYRKPKNSQNIRNIKRTLNGSAVSWMRPVVKLWFVAFAAKDQAQINFGRPGKVWTLTDPVSYNVEPLTGEEFGVRFGIPVPFINRAVAKLNQYRRESLQETIDKFQKPPPIGNSNLHRKYVTALANVNRRMSQYVKKQGIIRAPVKFLGNNGNARSYGGFSQGNVYRKTNTATKLQQSRNERIATATKPQQVRMKKAVHLTNVLLNQLRLGKRDPLTHNLNNNAQKLVEEAAEGDKRLLNLAIARAKEIDRNYVSNNVTVERFKNNLVRNVFNQNTGMTGLFSQQ